ncbi:hypothetical protein ARMGADRAFT_1022499 [Armillaria gallica]|uniref:Uncharacterized protein n=1 Tax=Armillaria gallica TaxID=47427 RepID=A0A2H3E975_ARMGA|nr:hypothetical protein ARMGADRAFT_1022499 [Armillaria gallica]
MDIILGFHSKRYIGDQHCWVVKLPKLHSKHDYLDVKHSINGHLSLPHFAKLMREWLDIAAATSDHASEPFDYDLSVSLSSASTNLNKNCSALAEIIHTIILLVMLRFLLRSNPEKGKNQGLACSCRYWIVYT